MVVTPPIRDRFSMGPPDPNASAKLRCHLTNESFAEIGHFARGRNRACRARFSKGPLRIHRLNYTVA